MTDRVATSLAVLGHRLTTQVAEAPPARVAGMFPRGRLMVRRAEILLYEPKSVPLSVLSDSASVIRWTITASTTSAATAEGALRLLGANSPRATLGVLPLTMSELARDWDSKCR